MQKPLPTGEANLDEERGIRSCNSLIIQLSVIAAAAAAAAIAVFCVATAAFTLFAMPTAFNACCGCPTAEKYAPLEDCHGPSALQLMRFYILTQS